MPCLMVPVYRCIVEHGRRGILADRHLAEEFLIRLEQGKNHRGHLSSNAPNYPQLAPIVLRALIIDRQTWEQMLINV